MGFCPCFGSWKKTKSKHFSQDFHGVSKKSANVELDPSVRKEGLNVIEKGRIFTYQELAIATKGFSEESFIGQGGFGTVYRGQLNTGEIVAVKQLNQAGLQGDKEFLVEVLMLSLLRNPNLVTLIGYCAEGDQRLLVYEYMPLGALEDHLHDLSPDMEPLDWNSRIMIAAGAANGLNFLHNEANPPVIYRDLKSSNILLGDGFHPKLSDFGLAKFGPVEGKTHVSTRVMGTHGYCAPEYALSGKLTMKSDIYSFGIVLLELVTGHRALEYVNGHAKYLVEWTHPILKSRKNITSLVDRKLRGQFPPSALRKVIEVASLCIRDDPNSRPSMKDVASALNFIKNQKYDPNIAKKSMRRKVEENHSPTETTVILEKDLERERAVAEARMWGETWREKRKQGSDYDLNR